MNINKILACGSLVFALGAFGADPEPAVQSGAQVSLDAEEFEVGASGYARLEAGIFDTQVSFDIASAIVEFNKSKERLAGVVVSKNIAGDSARQYAESIRDRWSPESGSPAPNVLIVIAALDRKVQVLTDRLIESEIPNSEIDRILNRVMIPALREGEYAEAVAQMLGGITGYLDEKKAKLAEQNLAVARAAQAAAAAEVERAKAEKLAAERVEDERRFVMMTWATTLAIGFAAMIGLYLLIKYIKRALSSSGRSSAQVNLVISGVCLGVLVALPTLYKAGFNIYWNSQVDSKWAQIGRVIYPDPTSAIYEWLKPAENVALAESREVQADPASECRDRVRARFADSGTDPMPMIRALQDCDSQQGQRSAQRVQSQEDRARAIIERVRVGGNFCSGYASYLSRYSDMGRWDDFNETLEKAQARGCI